MNPRFGTLLSLLLSLWLLSACSSEASPDSVERPDPTVDQDAQVDTSHEQVPPDDPPDEHGEEDEPASEEPHPPEVDEALARRAAEAHDQRFGPPPVFEEGTQEVLDPFEGVRILQRTTTTPRPLRYWVVFVDPRADGIGYRVTPSNGDAPRHTTRQTAVDFAEEHGVQVAINAHFYIPWPVEDDYADLLGLAVNAGEVVAPFRDEWEHALVIDAEGAPAMVTWDRSAGSATATEPAVDIAYAVGGRELVLTAGENTGTWLENHPRTIAGIHEDGHLVFLLVDGRQGRRSQGVTTPEAGEILLSLGVPDALNLDGGGSTTLVVADPEVRVLNSPVGALLPGTLRDNGSHLGVYARPWAR